MAMVRVGLLGWCRSTNQHTRFSCSFPWGALASLTCPSSREAFAELLPVSHDGSAAQTARPAALPGTTSLWRASFQPVHEVNLLV